MLNQYLKKLLKISSGGDATEESYYPAISGLFESFFESEKIKNGTITTLPKKTEGNKPDFVIRKGRELIGYIEAKDFLKIDNLEKVENDEQIERYKKDFDNFILTNFVDFWLWRKSEKNWVKKINIAKSRLITRIKTLPPLENEEKCLGLFQEFINFSIPETKNAKQLAIELASRAKIMREPLLEELKNNIETDVDKIYRAFKKYLMPDLSEENFVDIYAQTITYGLFIARLKFEGEGKDFNRTMARDLIPKNLKILRDTFSFVSRRDLTQNIDYIIDDIATVLSYCNIEKIKKDLHKEKGKDPIVHFYETFLIEYDPEKRKKMGEYYTPLQVVTYIVRSINILLKEKFEKSLGFASDGVTLLDFASGTCTFPAQAIIQTKEEVDGSSSPGSWLNIVKNHVLENFYAFEISMASWIIGHLKIALLLEDLEYKMSNGDRFKLYLTNTLDFTKIQGQDEILSADLSEEAQKAGEIKKEKPILVITGNPPYSVSSSNIIKKGSDFYNFYESYKETVRKEEKNIQPLSDDYIKFIAFAHWKIKKTGKGIIGIITNNSYLDGLIHRDIRRKLIEDFDEIYVLNLHGSSKRKEKTPEGGKDENVFNIQQGVNIILLSKNGSLKKKIKYSDVYGLREEKYKFLENHNIENTKWQDLEPKAPNYFLVPRDTRGEEKYHKFVLVKDIFSFNNVGGKPGDDKILVGYSKYDVKNKVNQILYTLKIDPSAAKTEACQNLLKISNHFEVLEDKIIRYNYRPFDIRYTYYDEKVYTRPVPKLKKYYSNPNLSLLTTKILKAEPFSHVFISEVFSDVIFLSNKTSTNTFSFPLYPSELSITNNQQLLLDDNEIKKSNIKKEIFELLESNYKKKVNPEEIFYYIYGILYSNKYRQKYNEFLKIDFPKIPFTSDNAVFNKLAKLGKELVEFHLLKNKRMEKLSAKFQGAGLNEVRKREYNQKEKRLYINDSQYFEGIETEVWNYYIGGYQVLDKWIKDRVGRNLSREEVEHYLKVIESLRNTIELQKEIDKIYPEIEKNLAK